jgi:predicted RNA-binding protein with RPS1 domain
MSEKISDLQFGKKYTGTLTNRPYDFGIFVEFEDYYTGLIHSTEFSNYEDIKRQYRSGDEIEFYIKNVTRKGKEYRIVLTTDPESIDAEKKRWDDLRSRTENQIFDYDVDQERSSIKIKIDDLEYEVTLKRKDLEETSKSFPKVKVFKVDPINKSLKFEFVN